MKERPILFSAPMVRALLAGTKTQTRRAVKPQPIANHRGKFAFTTFTDDEGVESYWVNSPLWGPVRCPYGKPGDRLWVRENGWERPERTPRMMRDGADTWERYYYDADGYTDLELDQFREWGFKRRPSIHMPRWASRITLEITGVRVDRLQDISEADAIAEGCDSFPGIKHDDDAAALARIGPVDFDSFPIARYAALWESINGPGSWDANPWVWVVEFRRISHA